jgi:hypothetical protein
VNGAQIDIRFLNTKGSKKKSPAKSDHGDMADA